MTSDPRPTAVFLHALGSSRRAWDDVAARLSGEIDCLALDLPGFGARASEGYRDIHNTLEGLCRQLQDMALPRWILVGHSMGGKYATLLAAKAQDGAPGLSGLVGVALVAASPPSPEPMEEARREEMLSWFRRPEALSGEARRFIEANTAAPLGAGADQRAVEDFERTHPDAWRGWLARGTKEDWSEEAGVIRLAALILAGAEDGDLGQEAQRRLNAPHFRNPDVVIVEQASHFIPLEQPGRLADLLRAFSRRACASALPTSFVTLLGSTHVSRRTRRALLERHAGPDADAPTLLDVADRDRLVCVVSRLLPDVGDPADLARRLDVALAAGVGDGWRFQDLPEDAVAWRRGLRTLHAGSPDFGRLDAAAQDHILKEIAEGRFHVASSDDLLSPGQMRLWFEDLRSEAARLWMSLPSTWAEIGYDGFATGGDGRPQGYLATGADQTEPWRLPPKPAT